MAERLRTRHGGFTRLITIVALLGAGTLVVAAFPQAPLLGSPFAIAALTYLASQSKRPREDDVAHTRRSILGSRPILLVLLSIAFGVGGVGLWYGTEIGRTEQIDEISPRTESAGLGAMAGMNGDVVAPLNAACDAIRTTDVWWSPTDTALSRAAMVDSASLATLLRQPHSPDVLGLALRDASATGNEASVRLLLDAGADPERSPIRAATSTALANGLENPTLVAVRMGSIGALELLLEAGANPDGDAAAWPLLLQALSARQNQVETIELLLAFGAAVNRTDSLGRTALHRAASYGCADAIEILLANGADRSLRDRDGRTAMDRAQAAGFEVLAVRLAN